MMQATKNGLKSALRTPGKTLLFVLILTVTSALLTVSCCVFGAVRGYLNDCDDYFHTIAELEYMGQNYPEQTVYDESFAAAVEENRTELEALVASDAVLSWEPASSELLYTPLIHRHDTSMPDPDAAVLRVSLHSYNENLKAYNAIVKETLYSRIDYTGKLILVRTPDSEKSLEYPCTYLIAGRFFAGRLQHPSVRQEFVSFYDGDTLIELPSELLDGAGEEAEAPFYRYAETLHVKNDACRVTYTAAIEDLYPFHQQVLTLTQGRYFTQEEYDTKAQVCIVSERVAGMLELGVGDQLPFTVYRAAGDLYDDTRHTLVDDGAFTIIGITSHSDSYPYRVFLPDADVGTEIRAVNGYTLGQFRLKNDAVPRFLAAVAPLLEQSFRLNVYDQGYAAATEPMEELLFISGIFLAVCLLLAACAMALQSHLFITRQRETARTMYAMGSGRAHVCTYFVSAALTLTVPGAALGAFIGKQAEGRVFTVLQRFAAQFAKQDLRFSASRLAVTRTLEFNPTSSWRSYLVAAAILIGGTLFFTLLFALDSLRDRKTARKKAAKRRLPKRAARVSRLSGFFKYGLLSLVRGRGRTVAVLLLGMTTALFFGRLTASLIGYQEQLESYKAHTVLAGSATDYLGKQISGLTLRGDRIAKLTNAELTENCCTTTSFGHIKILGPVGGEQIPYTIPRYGGLAYQSAFYWLNKQPLWIGTSSVSDSPLFHYSESGSVEWLDGWSEEDFTRIEDRVGEIYNYEYEESLTVRYRGGPAVCALPESVMEEFGIRLGDEIDTIVAFYHDKWVEIVYRQRLLVVAAYVAPVGSTTVFSPLTFVRPQMQDRNYFPTIREGGEETYWLDDRYYTGAELIDYLSNGLSPVVTYASFTFSLTDTERLDELRTVMADAGFTWVHSGERGKNYAVIEDEIYLNTVRSMERQIQYVEVLYGALYLLAGVIGFVLAWLLIQSRRQEIAVMRAMGTQPGRILGNFLLEHFLLMLAGLGVGIPICLLTGTSINQTQLLLTAAFLGLWTLSALICLLAGLLKPSYASLTEPD